ncbi:MAG: aldo/keto reductase [Candidatus Thermoplasmatota archaeon]|nr:aldo/keto reductase [Candidatus Thermoplasmatota archaeon]
MERVKFGNTDSMVTPMGVGTYYDFRWIGLAKVLRVKPGKDRRVSAIKAGLDSGINFIDTAEIYETEPFVREAIKGRNREDVFIATKVFPLHYSFDGVVKSCERSLRKLGTGYIDLYQLHMHSSPEKVKDALRGLEKLKDDGKIKHIGISNFNLKQTEEAVSFMKKHEIKSTQMNFNVAHRNIEKDLVPYCKENGIAILAYYPLAHGVLTSQSSIGKEVLDEIEKNHGKKTIPQIVLNWFYSKYDSVYPIPRASNPDHVKENAGSVGWKMAPEEITMLEDAASKIQGPSWSGDNTA